MSMLHRIIAAFAPVSRETRPRVTESGANPPKAPS